MWGAKSCEKLAPSSLGRPLRCVNQLIRGGMISVIFEGSFSIEKSFFTEWKQGNTPNEKQKNPAFGRVSFVWSLTLEHKDDYVSFGESVGIDVSVEGDVDAIVCGHRFFFSAYRNRNVSNAANCSCSNRRWSLWANSPVASFNVHVFQPLQWSCHIWTIAPSLKQFNPSPHRASVIH